MRMKGWSGIGEYDKNEEKEFHYSMENVEGQRIGMQPLEFSIPACGKQEGWDLNKILFYESYFNIFLGLLKMLHSSKKM